MITSTGSLHLYLWIIQTEASDSWCERVKEDLCADLQSEPSDTPKCAVDQNVTVEHFSVVRETF